MKFLSGLLVGVLSTLVAGAVGIAAWWIITAPRIENPSTKPVAPAKVAHVVKEDDLATITLTPEAEKRLDVHTAKIERRPLRQARVYGGEITIPVGRSIIVAAPLGGTLKAPSDGIPRPGVAVKRGQPILMLLPLLTPEGRTTLATAKVDADGQVENARTQFEAARIAFERAQRLFREEAGSRRLLDESQAQFELAQKGLRAVEARRELLARTIGEVEKGTAAPITIEAPSDGLLRSMSALADQNVPQSAALFEVADLSRVWIRVPVAVGDLPDLTDTDNAQVSNLTAKPGQTTRSARPVAAPPTASPLSSTVDRYFELDNPGLLLIPGQRVGVSLALKGEADSLAIPWSAVVHDVHGNTWVYERTKPHTYVRRRVVVRYVTGDQAALASGPPVGTFIVSAGAQELFGTETGFSK